MVRRILLFFACTIIFSPSKSQDIQATIAQARLIAKIDSILISQVEADQIPGAVIQIKKDGRVIYTSAYGYAQKYDYQHQLLLPPEMMSTEDLFDIASLTKVI